MHKILIEAQMSGSEISLATMAATFRSELPSNHPFIRWMNTDPGFKASVLVDAALTHASARRIDAACEAFLEAAELGKRILIYMLST